MLNKKGECIVISTKIARNGILWAVERKLRIINPSMHDP
jgi:hypothetical protein